MKKNATTRHVSVFLNVALKGPIDLKSLTKMAGGKAGTIYGDLQDLGPVATTGKEGYRLIEEVKPTTEGQAYLYRLSGRGRMAVEAMSVHLEAARAMHVDDEDDEPLEAYWESRALVRG